MPLEHLAPLKFTLERLFGQQVWSDLKESTSAVTWRKHLLRTLSAIRLAFFETVKVCDKSLILAVEDNLSRGEKALKMAKSVEDLLAAFSATLAEQVFIQLGTVPRRRPGTTATLSGKYWQLDGFRSVQYVQSHEQLEAMFWSEQQRRLGVGKQSSLYTKYRVSGSKEGYAQWCQTNEA